MRIGVVHPGFPATSAASIAERFEAKLKQLAEAGTPARFALLDHVSSQPAVLLPVADMTAACRRWGTGDIEVAIDGAHSVGSAPTNVAAIGANWFYSNLHKVWCHSSVARASRV